jgi:hypothetical protein
MQWGDEERRGDGRSPDDVVPSFAVDKRLGIGEADESHRAREALEGIGRSRERIRIRLEKRPIAGTREAAKAGLLIELHAQHVRTGSLRGSRGQLELRCGDEPSVHEKTCDGEHGHDYDEEEDRGSEFAQDEGLAFVCS